jgi:hypothetical protein
VLSKIFIRLIPLLLVLSPAGLACQNHNSKMPESKIITNFEDLLSYEGEMVTIHGIFVHYNAIPHFGKANGDFRAGILMEGDSLPRLFLFDPPESFDPKDADGEPVEVRGVFYQEERPIEGDPPYASKRSGSWLYDVKEVVQVD